MEKRITKRDYFNELKGIVANREDLVAFIDHELELLDKKASVKTPSKTQIENENIKNVIVATLIDLGKPSTITDIQNANTDLANLSNQKISALLTQLVKDNKVVRTVDKKKAYFTISE
jgi:hypothetical protein